MDALDALADQMLLVLRSPRGPEVARELLRVAVGVPPYNSNEDAGRIIVAATAAACGIRVVDIYSRSRETVMSDGRVIAMALVRELTGASYPDIGRLLDRDHTTVMSACSRVGLRPARMAAKIDAARALALEALGRGTEGARSLAQAPGL